MTTHGQWITKSTGIGASLGGVAGFFYGAYIMATNLALGWTDVLDTVGSAVVVLLFAVMIGSLCIVIGGLAGLVLGIGTFPLSSLSEKRWVREVCGGELRKRLDELSGRTPPRSFNNGDHEQGVGSSIPTRRSCSKSACFVGATGEEDCLDPMEDRFGGRR